MAPSLRLTLPIRSPRMQSACLSLLLSCLVFVVFVVVVAYGGDFFFLGGGRWGRGDEHMKNYVH